MFEIIRSGTKFDFVSTFKFTSIISVIFVLFSLFLVITRMQYGVDFRGGAEIQVKFKDSVNLTSLRKALSVSGMKGTQVQTIGELDENEVLIKVQSQGVDLNKLAEDVKESLNRNFDDSNFEIRKIDIVGPKAGAQLRFSGFLAMFWAIITIMVYIGLRFNFKYSPGAIVALIHDVSIIMGIFALLNIEFTLQTVAALLAVIGYSVNDTVIVYDRVREHEDKYAGVPLSIHINNAINETLSRTILTSGTTLFISLSMYFFGGVAIKDFFLAMTIGIIVGTYSSISVAAPVTLFLSKFVDDESKKATV